MYFAWTDKWYLERIIWVMAGVVSLLGLVLGIYVNKWWLILNAMVGVNLMVLGVTGFCLMASILHALGTSPRLCSTSPTGSEAGGA